MALGIFIALYMLATLGIGVYGAKLVTSTKDYCLAGRKLSLILCSSTMFSTWFGSETIIGASAEFLEHGLLGVIEDPFGTSLCFLLIGLFIARPIYKLNIVTIVDFFRLKYGVRVEKLSAFLMILSYLGWIAAQFLAMAIILKVALNIPIPWGVLISTVIVCLYTTLGGMWSISLNDFIQTMMIIVGLLFIAAFIYWENDPLPRILESTSADFFRFVPPSKLDSWVEYITAWITIGLGSIPQQDVFQRVMSAKSAKVAVQASFVSSFLYIFIGCLPLFITLAFKVSDPSLQNEASDQLLLTAILRQDNLLIKVFFFGALLSAIMSTASGAILAPATIVGENLLKPFYGRLSDRQYLYMLRVCVITASVLSGTYAAYSNNVYELVAQSSVISLVSLFTPLVAGLYWPKANMRGALYSILLGPFVWGLCLLGHWELYATLLGLFASSFGMVWGSLTAPAFNLSPSQPLEPLS